MNILICDDVKTEVERLASLIGRPSFKTSTSAFTRPADALEHVRSGAVVDLCFLDIIMPEINGIDMAVQLRNDSYDGEIVFLSSSNEYAAESYEVNAYSYILKPLSRTNLDKILSDIEQAKRDEDTAGIVVSTAGSKRRIMYRDISGVEVAGNNICFRMTDGSEIGTRATFEEIARKLLADERFIRCHRSYIVNMDDVVCAQGRRSFIMGNGAEAPISRTYSDAVQRYTERMSGDYRN